MNRSLLRFISKKIAAGGNKSSLLNFSRWIAFFSVALGTLALILSLSILEGYETALKENAIKFNAHIKASSFSGKDLPDYPAVMEKLQTSFPDDIRSIDPVIEKLVILRKRKFIDGALIKGIKPESRSYATIVNGDFEGRHGFTSDTAKEITLSRNLAHKAGLKVGDELIIYSITEAEGEGVPKSRIIKMKVTGLYSTGLAEYDAAVIFTPFSTAAGLFEFPESSCTSIEILTNDADKAPALIPSLEKQVGYPYFFRDVFSIQRAAFVWIEIQKEPIPLVLGLISVVAVLNIITALLIAVVEKTNTIGIMRALGATRKNIVSIFIGQGFRMGALASLTGGALALILCLLQVNYKLIRLKGEIYFLDSLPVHLSIYNFLVVIAASVALSVVATFIPAFIAGRVQPVKAIRWE